MVRTQEESGESHAERSGSAPSKYVGVGQRGRLLLPTGPGEPFSCPGKRFTVPQSHKTFATKKKGVPS